MSYLITYSDNQDEIQAIKCNGSSRSQVKEWFKKVYHGCQIILVENLSKVPANNFEFED